MDPLETGGTGDDPFANGIRLFNEGYFFEAHEHLEDLWHRERGESRLFLQGLIQVCAGFHHFQNGNPAGAVALLGRGADKMRRYPARYMDIDVAVFLARVDAARARIGRMAGGVETVGAIEFPKIEIRSGG